MPKEHNPDDWPILGKGLGNVDPLTEAELEALEDAENLRLGRERLRLAKIGGTVSWESVKAKYGL